MAALVQISHYVKSFPESALARWSSLTPWELTAQSSTVVREMLATLAQQDFTFAEEVAIHRSAVVEPGAVLKGPSSSAPVALSLLVPTFVAAAGSPRTAPSARAQS